MSDARKQLGNNGEDLALRYLEKLGMQLVDRNYRWRGGEIDLIVRDGAVLVFVEVRSKSGAAHGSPLETITYKKRRQIERCARQYLAHKKVSADVCCRFDAVGVLLPANDQPEINYVRDAFRLGE
ncbi:MAG: YraN family protein [Candidatus Riflebacteria bacterium HGW-Riflebacteria-1]|jgi:putative endonuclease|nr:MAG: YraN family protein [Candidatus Riflebacteria bacterium HGW-Riflebacteria-1]